MTATGARSARADQHAAEPTHMGPVIGCIEEGPGVAAPGVEAIGTTGPIVCGVDGSPPSLDTRWLRGGGAVLSVTRDLDSIDLERAAARLLVATGGRLVIDLSRRGLEAIAPWTVVTDALDSALETITERSYTQVRRGG